MRHDAVNRLPIAIALLALAAPAHGQVRSPIELTTDPDDRLVMAEASAAVASREPDLARLDAVLGKLPRPTPLCGMVQSVRAHALAKAERIGDAVAAIDEALRLLPDHPAPKMTAVPILTFAGAPQRAADLWLELARSSPEMARAADEYLLMALNGRLRDLGDRSRSDRLLARMGEIGFAAGSAPQRSASASARVRSQLASGDLAGAEASISVIGDPSDMLTLLIDRRYQALWTGLERWGGPGLEAQSRRYLEELRREWAESGDFKSAANYARVLAAAREYGTVVALFAPMFERPDLAATSDMEFLAPVVARALAAVGREGDGARLLARVSALFPADGSGRDLNLLAASMTTDANALRWAAVVPRATEFLNRARIAGPAVNRSAVLQVLAVRGCAHWRLGHRPEAERDMAEVLIAQALQPAAAWRVLLCRGDEAAQRAFLLARLADEDTRGWALRVAQPPGQPSPTALDRIEHAAGERMRRDPAFVAAVAKVGRVLPHPIGDRLPVGFDPFAVRPSARRSPDDI